MQVIVIDDNSTTDNSLLTEIITTDNRCEFYKNDRGVQSAGACRNIGLTHATGKWLLFADADDCFAEDFLNSVDKYLYSDADIIYFMPTSVMGDTGEPGKRHLYYADLINAYHKNSGRSNEIVLRFDTNAPWSKLIRRSIVDKNSIWFDQTPVANDVMFCTKVAYVAKQIETSYIYIYIYIYNSVAKLASN